MDAERRLLVLSVYIAVSALILASSFVPLGTVIDIAVSPSVFSSLLLVPLFVWYRWFQQRETPAHEDEGEKNAAWIEVSVLFLLAMAVRVPFVQFLGMAYEKTAVVYLVVLTIVYAKGSDLGVYGFRSERFIRSLLVGVAYYVVFALPFFAAFFGLAYLSTGHLAIIGYDLAPSLFVLPFMTFCVGISEEGLFRGFMQTRLENLCSERKALLVQALLFGLWHFVWHISPFNPFDMTIHILTSFAFGLAFGQFYRLSRNLVPLILAHGLVDTVGYGAIYTPELEGMASLVQGFQGLSFIVGIAFLALLTNFLAKKACVKHT